MQTTQMATWFAGLTLVATLAGGASPRRPDPLQTATPPAAATQSPYSPGVPFTAEQINTLLPQTVYFQGRTAPLQLRNAGGMLFAGDQIVWVSLVDSSGYATSVQEKYQFYLVTEGPLQIDGIALKAGAYGGGFVNGRCLLMDLGGHTLGEAPVQTDTALPRPRPLQLLASNPAEARLLLGRRFVKLEVAPQPNHVQR